MQQKKQNIKLLDLKMAEEPGQFSKEDTQVATKLMKNCSRSLIIREMQIQITVRCPLTLLRMATLKKNRKYKCCLGCAEIRTLFTVSGNVKWCNCYGE